MLLDFLFQTPTKTRPRVRNTRLSVESLENRIVPSTLGLSAAETTSLEPGPGDPLIGQEVSNAAKGIIISIDPEAAKPGPGDPITDEIPSAPAQGQIVDINPSAPAQGQIVDINPSELRPGPGDPLDGIDIGVAKPAPGDPLEGSDLGKAEPGPGDPLKDES